MKPLIVKLSSSGSTALARAGGGWLALLLTLPALGAGVSRGFNQLLDSVVRIDVREVVFDEGTRRFEASIGSGVLLYSDGLVLTNAHVVGPRAIEIKDRKSVG